jgi:lipopolysaccharide export system protein LptA
MKRRAFLTAMAPLIAVTQTAVSQGQLGSGLTEPSLGVPGGRLRPGTPAAPVSGNPAATPADPAKAAKGPTEITSSEAMLDNRMHLATFSGEVEVKDPEFTLTCDKLTVYLKKPKEKKAEVAQPRAIGAEDEPAPKAAEKEGSGIERAVAEGNVILIQEKQDANGKKQRYYGKARRAVFDNDKKTCVLYGWPSVSQSLDQNMGKEIIATQENTVITLDQAGVIKADGPNRVRLNDVNALEQKK